jgi:hypothetical protein
MNTEPRIPPRFKTWDFWQGRELTPDIPPADTAAAAGALGSGVDHAEALSAFIRGFADTCSTDPETAKRHWMGYSWRLRPAARALIELGGYQAGVKYAHKFLQ